MVVANKGLIRVQWKNDIQGRASQQGAGNGKKFYQINFDNRYVIFCEDEPGNIYSEGGDFEISHQLNNGVLTAKLLFEDPIDLDGVMVVEKDDQGNIFWKRKLHQLVLAPEEKDNSR